MKNVNSIHKNRLKDKLVKFADFKNSIRSISSQKHSFGNSFQNTVPEILFITSYPPRECGIATYSEDLIVSLKNKFKNSFKIGVCALETDTEKHEYSEIVEHILNTDKANEFADLAEKINNNAAIELVLIQHEFGLFAKNETQFQLFLEKLTKPIVIVFHTVLPKPDAAFKQKVQNIVSVSQGIIVMTSYSSTILQRDYDISSEKITVIPHGTHLVSHPGKDFLKEKYGFEGRKVLSTFGLLSSGKNIETTLDALPSVVKNHPETLFLILGKTHPSVAKQDGEQYRNMLEAKVEKLGLKQNVLFVNKFLPLADLLEYLQLTDIYLFTSKDPNQAVSGTFSYALSCGCPIISTPIPQSAEVSQNDAGIIFDFENSVQLSSAINTLLGDESLRNSKSINALHMMAPTAWENAAISHAIVFEKINDKIKLNYRIPEINLNHLKKLTTDFGMIQFSIIDQPDLLSGYTIDDNARAMVAIAQHYELTNDQKDIEYIKIYLNFIHYCQQSEGYFLNYVDEFGDFTEQNNETNLADSNGRAIWALGYLISQSDKMPIEIGIEAKEIMQKALVNVHKIHSTRAMAFIIKGIYYANLEEQSPQNADTVAFLANRLLQMYRHESSAEWNWYESYLTYANSILPEAMLCAFLVTGDPVYKITAKATFDFLIEKIFSENRISVISNKNWLQKSKKSDPKDVGGEQAIDVAYTILALRKFHEVFHDENYKTKMNIAFSWFLGNNHLHQIIYNPVTGGCYDGLEDEYMNLNQGAESTVSYLMARFTMEKAPLPPVGEYFREHLYLAG
jgi:glycosyltransferase involved in cell wall biosynthesis